ncbi:cob(I)yrinic acid a,c-diamide adenosyltransferase [Candidatus Amesbacteria bacterium]|nr:cob(I)yrinic acid a,c-diamide adenosyltransferase [Candidatus Amesbacteria bacterium]MBI2587274.1 cob(I)yrinic acid a,c-diamide adenosyltransferase [Candidatus Amesbacteria bacterium]
MTRKIYTRTGDRGETGTMRGRMSKSDQLAAAIGSVDEVNSWVGLCRENSKIKIKKSKSQVKNQKLIDYELKEIQTNLFVIGSILAGAKGQRFKGTETKRLEKLIDKLTLQLPKLDNFVYPVGYLQVARAVARRCEREIVNLSMSNAKSVNKNILKYLNRLSDALFVMARWVNLKTGVKEEIWRG